jgi:hypothetical protein
MTILVRMAVMTGVCFIEREMTSDKRLVKYITVTDKFEPFHKGLFHKYILMSESLVILYCLFTQIGSKVRLARFRRLCDAVGK